jgi:hypothetical protein
MIGAGRPRHVRDGVERLGHRQVQEMVGHARVPEGHHILDVRAGSAQVGERPEPVGGERRLDAALDGRRERRVVPGALRPLRVGSPSMVVRPGLEVTPMAR